MVPVEVSVNWTNRGTNPAVGFAVNPADIAGVTVGVGDVVGVVVGIVVVGTVVVGAVLGVVVGMICVTLIYASFCTVPELKAFVALRVTL